MEFPLESVTRDLTNALVNVVAADTEKRKAAILAELLIAAVVLVALDAALEVAADVAEEEVHAEIEEGLTTLDL